MALPFLKDFKKAISKIDTVGVDLDEFEEYVSLGNYALNRILSGDFNKGIPLCKMSAFVGPSGSGKSFLSGNALANAQKLGFHLVVIDTEKALSVNFLRKIGVDVSEDKLTRIEVTTIEDVNKVCSEFFSGYIKAYGRDNYEAPRTILLIDSLAGLSSETEHENYQKSGVIKADQGILAKRRKSMLKMITNTISRLPIACLITDHVYPQDVMLGDGPWAITNSVKYYPTLIGLVTKLKLKDDTTVIGVRMRIETYKSRFTKIGGKVEIEVPYNTGMNAFSGLVDILMDMKVIAKGTQAGEKSKYIYELEDVRIAFKEDELTDEICQIIFQHPNCQPINTVAGAEMDALNNPELVADIEEEEL